VKISDNEDEHGWEEGRWEDGRGGGLGVEGRYHELKSGLQGRR